MGNLIHINYRRRRQHRQLKVYFFAFSYINYEQNITCSWSTVILILLFWHKFSGSSCSSNERNFKLITFKIFLSIKLKLHKNYRQRLQRRQQPTSELWGRSKLFNNNNDCENPFDNRHTDFLQLEIKIILKFIVWRYIKTWISNTFLFKQNSRHFFVYCYVNIGHQPEEKEYLHLKNYCLKF